GLTVQARRTGPRIAATEVEPKLGGDHHFSAERRKGFANNFLIVERAVHFSGVKECDAVVHGGSKQSRHLLLIFGRAVGKTHSHATESDGRNFQVPFSKSALLHFLNPFP